MEEDNGETERRLTPEEKQMMNRRESIVALRNAVIIGGLTLLGVGGFVSYVTGVFDKKTWEGSAKLRTKPSSLTQIMNDKKKYRGMKIIYEGTPLSMEFGYGTDANYVFYNSYFRGKVSTDWFDEPVSEETTCLITGRLPRFSENYIKFQELTKRVNDPRNPFKGIVIFEGFIRNDSSASFQLDYLHFNGEVLDLNK